VKGHKEIAALLGRKIDPNLSMDEFRSKLGWSYVNLSMYI
jgi:hypothetical protein